jgi:Tol biopolymer transport system component
MIAETTLKMSSIKVSFDAIVSLLTIFIAGCSPIGEHNSNGIDTSVNPSPTQNSTRLPVLTSSRVSGWAVYSQLVSHEPFVTQIFLEDLNTGNTRQLTNSGNNDFPRWSPDGSQILFLSWTTENRFDIYLMNKDGSHQQPIVASSADEMMPDWSPDGSKIAYASNESGKYCIYIIDLLTQVTVKLTTDSVWDFSPKWSTDGKQIAFISTSSDNNRDGRSQVFIMNADGTNIRQMTHYSLDNFDDRPVWCPDDSCIIFTRPNGPLKLMMLNLANSDVTPFLSGIFGPEIQEAGIDRSQRRGYITFSVSDGNTFYAMDITTGEIFPLGVKGLELSLYP